MKKVITILLTIMLICLCGCGGAASNQTKNDVIEPKEINGDIYYEKEWNDDEYGTIKSSFIYTGDTHSATVLSYIAASDDPSNLKYLCNAINEFIALTYGSAEQIIGAILPDGDSASLTYVNDEIIGTELDGSVVNGIPSWYDENNVWDDDFTKWIEESYMEMVDQVNEQRK